MEQSAHTIYQPEFWEEQWDALNSAATVFSGYGSAATWNAMAADYGKRRDPGEIDERIDATLDRLERGGVAFENATVLDVGCGPGRFAAAFARRGARVFAVDISEMMVERLRIETEPQLLPRISPVVADWKSLDLERHGFVEAFDLVFANMTPAVVSPEAFMKLMAAGRRWCWFRGWVGRRENPLLERLHRAVFGERPDDFRGNFICAWNLASAAGYFPDCSFETVRWTHKKPLDECVGFYAAFFSRGNDAVKGEIARKIEASLSEIALGGFIENTVTGHTGSMLWTVG
ncbi:MAG: class I SAM-dependent methyltransferase [Chitinispirillaceae bacterium]|nr:class I SAM-dependent methyltransferase [Chitinispirillaceae bacterium]